MSTFSSNRVGNTHHLQATVSEAEYGPGLTNSSSIPNQHMDTHRKGTEDGYTGKSQWNPAVSYFFKFLVSALALSAFVLVVLVIIKDPQIFGAGPNPQTGDRTTSMPGPTTEQLQYQITQLENANQALLDRFLEMERLLGLDTENATVSLRVANNTLKINRLEVRINNFHTEFTTMLMTMNQSIYDELDVISKMPGPRGYNGSQGEKGDPGRDGAGNLTLCVHQRYQGGGGFGSTTTTAWIGSETEVATGVSCSTDGGDTETLEIRDGGGYNQYRCACSGGSGPGTRFCYMDIWRCPVNI
ncbi:uncharacterized protein [Ptychodera flava]|uniref:uncharacterized protein n=1 Tax=Ptychodera flava TaxID=63121 RepID=UPI00396A1052